MIGLRVASATKPSEKSDEHKREKRNSHCGLLVELIADLEMDQTGDSMA